MHPVELDIRPLEAPAGAEIVGLDASSPPGPGVVAAMKDALARHGVVVLRRQRLQEERAQLAFSEAFGDFSMEWLHHGEANTFARLHDMPKRPAYTGAHPSIHYFVNGPGYWENPDDGYLQDWHADLSYLQTPLPYSFLYALESSGDEYQTWYTNQYAVYDGLDDTTKRRIADLFVAHDFREVFPNLPPVLHPVAPVHPISGRRAVYGIPGFAKHHPVGLAQAEGTELMRLLAARATSDDVVYKHVWRPGDLVIWDNRCTIHRRGPQVSGETRILRRTQAADGTAADLRKRLLGMS